MTMQRTLPVVAALLALAGCATDEGEKLQRRCPQTAIVHELERATDYGKDEVAPQNLVARAVMHGVTGGCQYGEDGVEVDFTLALAAEKGPRLGGSSVSFPYFVSLVEPDRAIRGKELMTANFAFEEGKKSAESAEPIHVFIPLAKDDDAGDYQILAGFQLTEEQIAETRARQDAKIERIIGTEKP